MRKIEILITFTGDPDETGAATTRFSAGSVVDVNDTFAALVIGKGLARDADAQIGLDLPITPPKAPKI